MEKMYHSLTIQKALDVLNLFKEHRRLSLTDMQQLLGINKSTLFRVLYTLQYNKYLSKDERGRYELGLNVFILGNRVSGEYQLKKALAPFMKKLSEQINLTVHLGIWDGTDVVIIEKAEPNKYIKMVSRIGGSVPAHCTGQGKTLLAYSPKETAEKVINAHGLERYTPHTICTADALFAELGAIRARGYAIDNSEHEKNIRCVAVPILDETGKIVAALSVTGTTVDFPDEETIIEVAGILKDVRDKMRKEMGYLGTTGSLA